MVAEHIPSQQDISGICEDNIVFDPAHARQGGSDPVRSDMMKAEGEEWKLLY